MTAFLMDATATDDQAPGPVNFLMNRDVPGTALGLFFLGSDAAQVCNSGGPNALDEVHLRGGLIVAATLACPARLARADHDARAGGAERAGERCWRHGPGGAFGLRHPDAARHVRR